MSKGIFVSIFRSAGVDCTNNGISSQFEEGVVTGDLIERGVIEPSDTAPEYVIIERKMFDGTYLHAVPKSLINNNMTMAGGNFLYSTDNRFPSKQPISIHDRVE